jgi:pimeloyl-ACP methyl ester carboxylesterase
VVLRAGTKDVLRRVMEGGVRDPRHLPADLIDDLWVCGSLPGHARAFRSLLRQWETWITARAAYAAIEMPVTLVYGEHDWSWPEEREANRRVVPGARSLSLDGCGHFAALERPEQIAQLIREEVARAGIARAG